eukprot:1158586-Pelagomonas_calceolata.AAC.4
MAMALCRKAVRSSWMQMAHCTGQVTLGSKKPCVGRSSKLEREQAREECGLVLLAFLDQIVCQCLLDLCHVDVTYGNFDRDDLSRHVSPEEAQVGLNKGPLDQEEIGTYVSYLKHSLLRLLPCLSKPVFKVLPVSCHLSREDEGRTKKVVLPALEFKYKSQPGLKETDCEATLLLTGPGPTTTNTSFQVEAPECFSRFEHQESKAFPHAWSAPCAGMGA